MTTSQLSAAEQRLALSRAYALLGALWQQGVTPALRAFIVGLPELDAAIPTPYDADQAAADHYALLGLAVFPYASAFLEETGQVGGDVSVQAAAAYAAWGYRATSDSGPDHVGVELDALAFLVGAEADALRDDLPAAAKHMRLHQREFLTMHLLPWLQPFLVAVEGSGLPFYTALADLTRRIVLDHLVTLDVRALPERAAVPPPDPTAPETTLHDLADYLMTPVRAGIFVSRADLQALSRAHDAPAGFGDRRRTLVNLFRSAATYDLLPPLLAGLAALAQRRRARYVHAPAPELDAAHATLSAPWIPRVDNTLALLAQMALLAQTSQLDLSVDPSAEDGTSAN